MKLINNYFTKLDKFSLSISVITLFVMMLWIVIDVLLRYFFNSPIQGTLELTGEYFMVLIVYLSISYAQKDNEHVNVVLFYEKFPKKVRYIVNFFVNILGSSIFFYIAYLNVLKGLEYTDRGIKSSGLMDYPLAPALFIIAFGLIMLGLRLLIESLTIVIKK